MVRQPLTRICIVTVTEGPDVVPRIRPLWRGNEGWRKVTDYANFHSSRTYFRGFLKRKGRGGTQRTDEEKANRDHHRDGTHVVHQQSQESNGLVRGMWRPVRDGAGGRGGNPAARRL